MEKEVFKELRLKLPSRVIETISEKEIINLIIDTALTKAEYYHSKCKEMEEKYGMDLTSFKRKTEETEKEVFTEWDDLIMWEGYELGYHEWASNYEELKGCLV